MLMVFFQRIVNVEREYGLGRGALDFMIEGREHRYAIEVELRRDTETTEDDALDQLARDLDHAGLDAGWLVLFDLRAELSGHQRLTTRELERRGKQIHLVTC